MPDQHVSLEAIEDFLAQKRIAMVGISHDPNDFSATLFEEFSRRGYEVVPVNPKLPQAMGKSCFGRVQEIQPPLDTAILMTSPAVTDAVVRDCAEAGIRRVWLYSPGTQGGAVSANAIEFCREHGIQVVAGHCPLMFWRDAHWGHRLHGVVLKVIGRYPRRFHPRRREAA